MFKFGRKKIKAEVEDIVSTEKQSDKNEIKTISQLEIDIETLNMVGDYIENTNKENTNGFQLAFYDYEIEKSVDLNGRFDSYRMTYSVRLEKQDYNAYICSLTKWYHSDGELKKSRPLERLPDNEPFSYDEIIKKINDNIPSSIFIINQDIATKETKKRLAERIGEGISLQKKD